MRSFMERLIYPYLTYNILPESLFQKKISTGYIYTMNVTEEMSKASGYEMLFASNEYYLNLFLVRLNHYLALILINLEIIQ